MKNRLSVEILKQLKELFLRKSLTYKQVAARMKMSESGLKKLMTSKDCSLGKLEKLAEIAEVTLAEIIKTQDHQEVVNISFTPEIELFFLKERQAFFLYWLVVYERRSLKSSQTLLKINDERTFKILRRLDQFGLLTLLPNNKLRIPKPTAIRWVGSSEFVNSLYQKWGNQMLADLIHTKRNEKNNVFLMRYIQMLPETYQSFINELRDLEIQYVHRAIREMKIQTQGLRHVRWIFMTDNQSYVEREIDSF